VKKRLVIYPILILSAIIFMILPSFLTSPQRNLNSVAAVAKNNPQQSVHKTFSSYFKQFPGGYVLTFHTGRDSSFGNTEFVSISRMGDETVVDIINGAGPQNAHRLRGPDAQNFIEEHQIDLSPFDALVDDK
jgi:hypothetical protein